MTLVIESPQVYTQMGVSISVTGIAQVSLLKTEFKNLINVCTHFHKLQFMNDSVVN